MSGAEALHTAARWYLQDRDALWARRYAEMRGSSLGSYSARELDTFPRYQAARAMLAAIEGVLPTELGSLATARERLASIGASAASPFTDPPPEWPIAQHAIEEERAAFTEFVRGVSESDLAAVPPLSYRYVLPPSEATARWQALGAVWDIPEGGYWYPLTPSTGRELIAFDANPFSHAAQGPKLISSTLAARGVTRVWELREGGSVIEQDLSQLEPWYDGEERYWTSEALDWIIYASHESSVTIGGQWLIGAVQAAWPAWQKYLWRPFDA